MGVFIRSKVSYISKGGAIHASRWTPEGNRLNRDEGYEVPGCWIATMQKLGEGLIGATPRPPVTCILECAAVYSVGHQLSAILLSPKCNIL